MTCPSNSDRCGTAYIEGNTGNVSFAVFAKSCSTSAFCNQERFCKASRSLTKITKCEVKCCSGNLCNEANEPSPQHGLKCYQCASTKGWDDCAVNRKEQICPLGFDRCGTTRLEGTVQGVSLKTYDKGCTTSAVCNKGICDIYATDPSAHITTCAVYCCAGTLCNAAALPMISTIFLVTCAVVSFAF